MISRVTLLGHKDHGKSTLIGSLLISTGSVTQERLNDAKKISQQLGRQFEPAYILDSFSEEREGEMTIDITRAQIKYKEHAFEFIDVPGHEELIKNMMSGASYADFALLLVSAKPDEGIRDQTKRHLFLAKMMGIRRIVIAVNKMDTVDYSEARFKEIRKELVAFLTKIGFQKKNLALVPISAYNAQNLIKLEEKMPWYRGEPLLDEIVSLSTKRRADKKGALRVILQGALEGTDMLSGKVIRGTLSAGEGILLPPRESRYTIKEVVVKGRHRKRATAGENLALTLAEPIDFEPRGQVICGLGDDLKATNRVNAILFATKKLGEGTKIKFNGSEISCSVKVDNIIDITSGDTRQGSEIEPLGAGNVTLDLSKVIVAEPFDKLQEMGRFVIYDNGGFAGIGIITS